MYVGEQEQEPPEYEEPLENCAQCRRKLEGEDQMYWCSSACETAYLADQTAEAQAEYEAMQEMERQGAIYQQLKKEGYFNV
jgi:hypothetical protein